MNRESDEAGDPLVGDEKAEERLTADRPAEKDAVSSFDSDGIRA